MTRREFKQALYELFDSTVDGMSHEEKTMFIEKIVCDYQRDRDEQRKNRIKADPGKMKNLW